MQTKLSDKYREEVARAAEVMRRGGIILYPTDTIWGLGCDAGNSDAVRRIFDLKQRNEAKSMLVLIDSEAKLQGLITKVPEIAYDLYELSDRPLTIIFSGARNVAPELLGDDGSLGIRITREAFSRELCRVMRTPVVSTSANISGDPDPRNFSQINHLLIDRVDYVVGVKQSEKTVRKPSQIILLAPDGAVKVLRQ